MKLKCEAYTKHEHAYYNPSQYKYRVIEELHIVQQQSWIATATAYTVLSELYTVLPCIEAC